jgi:hypothetical protein
MRRMGRKRREERGKATRRNKKGIRGTAYFEIKGRKRTNLIYVARN